MKNADVPKDDIAQLLHYALDSVHPEDCMALDRLVPLTKRIVSWLHTIEEDAAA
jgi:hypothetical protein